MSTEGSLKRCGGQGDVLSGVLGTFVSYKLENTPPLIEAVLACMVTRMAAKVAFEEKGRSLVTPDIIEIGLSKVMKNI